MSQIKKITVFGATGNLGKHVLEEATNLGLDITLLLRDPSLLPAEYKDKVKVITGNVVNADDVEKVIAGAEGVVVALGTRTNLDYTTELSRGTENIVTSMKNHNIRPLSVCLSSFLFFPPDKIPASLREINSEHGRMLQVLEKRAGDVDYIAVCPPHLGKNPRGEYITGYDVLPGGRVVALPDLAHFMIASLSLPEHFGKRVGISSKIQA